MDRQPGTVNREQRGRHGGLFSADTSPEARAILVRLMREMTPEQKSRQMWALTSLTRALAAEGLRCRYPMAPARELQWRLVALLHGRETARRAYGWDPDAEEGRG